MKILVLGNETSRTDELTSELAKTSNTINHGLISDPNLSIDRDGYYHTTVSDLTPGEIVQISNKFNRVIMLDQPKESYPHYKVFVTTLRLMYDLEMNGIATEYQNNESAKSLMKWRQYLKENKSFCFYPFLALLDNIDETTICPKNKLPITKSSNIVNWQTNAEYMTIRNKMAAGELMPERCSDCYDREIEGQESTRQYETLEWTQRLSLESVDDFFKIKSPVVLEMRPSNMCNIMCRTCDDGHSHLIEREWKTIGIPLVDWKYTNSSFDNIDFNTVERIYWAGGEPTIMPEFYDFLQRCISAGRTDFELNIGTNGMKFSDKIVKLLDNFTNVCFSFSYDGYREVNDYIRWRSNFDTIVDNGRMLRDHGHRIGLQTVFSMWSITRMHEVFEFYDSEYLGSGLLVQVGAGQDDAFMPFNHPCPELVLESMRRCQQTKIYYMNGRSIKSMIDLMIDYYSNPNYKVDVELLRKFYEFNDKLDQVRNTQLINYIPELEQARTLYFK